LNAPGKELGEVRELGGKTVLTDAELEYLALQQEAPQTTEPESFEPQKTMIRSLDELF
jgi:hypothetical protein